jgi:transglutaminase-like putative cysteine protease
VCDKVGERATAKVVDVRVRVGCEFVQRTDATVHAVLQVEPRLDGRFALLDEHWDNEPRVATSRYVDGFGNLCRRVDVPAGDSVLRYSAVVELAGDPDPAAPYARENFATDLPDDTLAFTLPSRLCPSDELKTIAWDLFGDVTPGWQRVQAICDWVHEEITFGYGTSTAVSTASDVLTARKGVCRDFAHLGVTFCRALSIPARYTFGYLPDIGNIPTGDPMDFCAWMEVFLDGSWWTFDPRNNEPRVGRVLIGRGRDALDVAMVTTYGVAELVSMTVWADEVAT